MIHHALLTHALHTSVLTPILTGHRDTVLHALTPVVPQAAPTSVQEIADKIKGFIEQIFKYFLPIGLALCALYYGWGGLHYIAAGGSPVLVQKARSIWWHATVGVVGVILATPVVTMIHGLFS